MGRGWRIIVTGIVFILPLACNQERSRDGQSGTAIHAEEKHEKPAAEPAGFVSLEEASRLGPMKVETVVSRSLSGAVSATGEVQYNPEMLAHLTARVSGWVQEIHAFQEDTVQKGAILALIDSPDYLTAQTEYLMALRRSSSSAGPEEDRTAQALLASARSRLLLLGAWEEDLEVLSRAGSPQRYLALRSPIDGTLIESSAVKGNALRPGDNLYRIANLSTLWVILDIFEQDLARVQNGAPVRITTAAFPNESFQGRLTLLSQRAQEATRTVQARVVIENHHRRLRPGMFVQAQIQLPGGNKALTVPESAVFLYQGQETVFVQTKDGYQATPIKSGRRQGGEVEVLEGLPHGSRVVVDGGFALKAQLMKETMGEGYD